MIAQQSHTVDFEPAGVGADWEWTVVENSDNPAIEVMANPVSGGNNTSANVAMFTARADGNPWALAYTDDDGSFTFDANNSTVSVMVYKSVISPVAIKFEGMSPAIEIQASNTLVNQWENLTFDFSGSIGNTYSRFILIPDFMEREQDNVVYFDNIVTPDGDVLPPPAEPTTAPETPTEAASSVISIYSDSYDNIPDTNYNPGWGQSTVVTVNEEIAGNNTLKYANLNYQGTEFTVQNVSGYDYLHVDFWTPNSTTLEFYLISTGAEGSYTLPITHEQWVSVDIPLSAYSGSVDLADVFQFKVVGNGTVWFDNYYFFQDSGGTTTEPTTSAAIPTQDAANVISIYSDTYDNVPNTNYSPDWGQNTIVTVNEMIAGNNTLKYANLNYQGTEFTSQNLVAYEYLHVDFWTADAASLDFFVISPGAETSYSLPITQEQWVSVDIPLSHYSDVVNLAEVFQFKVVGNGTVWFDNFYFWHGGGGTGNVATLNEIQINDMPLEGFNPTIMTYDVVLPIGTSDVPTVTATATSENASVVITDASDLPGSTTIEVTSEDMTNVMTYTLNFTVAVPIAEPTTAPEVPMQNADNVISIYSDAYDNVPDTNYNPDWGQNTVVTVNEMIAGNNTLKYADLNYQGTEFTTQNLSEYEFLHVDFWTPNSTDLGIFLVSTGAETEYEFTILTEQWVSVDIPLSFFSDVVNLADVFQFKVVGNGTIWFDNLYFWRTSGGDESVATLSDLQVDGSTVADFSSNVFNYNVVLPQGTTDVPTVTATTTIAGASHIVIPATELPGSTEVEVTSQDQTVELSYFVHFTVEDPSLMPTTPAPTPTVDPTNVTSLFSNAYDNVTVDTWSAAWDSADLEDYAVGEDDIILYTNFVYAGIEFTSQTIDASNRTHLHLDIWTPDPTALPALFKVKLVDFGADGVWGNDDVEHEITFDETVLATSAWVSLDIPFEDLTGLVTRNHLAQLIISGDMNTIYVDNIYFYNDGTDNSSEDVELATNHLLGNNYPNPFNPETTISFSLKEAGNVSLKVYNTKGQLVETLVNNTRSAKTHNVVWRADNLSSGIYFYQLKVNNKVVDTKKMILQK
jgi:hypothetical protein